MMKKRFLATFLACFMILSLLPAAVFAEGTPATATISIAAATEGEKLVPGADVKLSLDGNVTVTGDPSTTVAWADLTITDPITVTLTKDTEPKTIQFTKGTGATDYTGKIPDGCAAGDYTLSAEITATKTVDGTTTTYAISATGSALTVEAATVAVTGVTINGTDGNKCESATIKVGETLSLTAAVTPEDATNKNVTWESSDTNVATVAGGTVTAKAVGSTTITATAADGKGAKGTCTVTVEAATTGGGEGGGSGSPSASGALTKLDVAKYLVEYNQLTMNSIALEDLEEDDPDILSDCKTLTPAQQAVVAAVYSNQWMVGDSDGNFLPNGKVTRAEAAVALSRVFYGSPEIKQEPYPFTDIPEWLAPYVTPLYKAGIITDTDATAGENDKKLFKPNDNITREVLERWLTNGKLSTVEVTNVEKNATDANSGLTVSFSQSESKITLSGSLNIDATAPTQVTLKFTTNDSTAGTTISFAVSKDSNNRIVAVDPIICAGHVLTFDVSGLTAAGAGTSTGGNTPSGGNTPGTGGTTTGGSGSSSSDDSSSDDSSSSSSSSSTTTTNSDGSTTTKTEDTKTGTVTETTTGKDGSKTVVETKKDGSKTTTMETKSGAQATTQVSASGQTEVKASIPASAVTDARGEAVAIPMPEVTATRSSDSAPVITVTTNSSSPVKVEVPVANASVTTVAVLVKADGTEVIVKTSLLTEKGVSLPVENGATVKIVDNAKSFVDTGSHWASKDISFVSSREIFSGVGDGAFAPESTMTRGMLVTVLASFDGAEVTGGEKWYDKSVEWAKAHGVSDGTNPEGQVTREQLASMLWSYAGRPAPKATELTFNDASQVSGYANQALCWAVENGIMSGMGNNVLDPQGNATRAQVATMMARFVEQ